MDIAVITGAYTGLKAAKDILANLVDQKIEVEASKAITEAMDKMGIAQDTFFALREELFKLQDDNRSLQEQLSAVTAWEDTMSAYSLEKTSGGAVVYKSSSEPMHFVCPSCLNKKELHILQEAGGYSGFSICPSCSTQYLVRPHDDPPAIDYKSPY